MYNNNIKKWIALCYMGFVLTLPTSLFANTAEEEKTSHIPMEDVQRFSDAVNLIKKYYVKPVNNNELFNNAIRGMLTGLDPHSSFLDTDELNELQATTSGEFGGLGIEVTSEDGLIKIITPIVDSPAFKAGIKPGDYIIKLGTQSVEGMTLKDAVALMRGPVGSTIELTILRKGAKKPLFISLIREKILIKSVKSKLLDNHYGYIRITQFQASTAHDMEKAIEELKQQAGGNLRGLILDLRNNPGGLLDSAIQVADDFLDNPTKGSQELIVYTQGRLPGSEFRAKANGNDLIKNSPIIVLINNGSASASEIVAGALKDNKRAIILGTRSFGKGSVQTVLPLDEKRAIKLTTALYYTPAGISIQAKGITPDIVVEEISLAKNSKISNGFDYSESGLQGHLANGNDANTNKSEALNNQDDEKLMHEDYQLYAALTVLKGLAVAKN